MGNSTSGHLLINYYTPQMKIIIVITAILIAVQGTAQDFEWATRAGGIGGERSKSIALDVNKNVYTVGTFRDTADFDPGPNVFNLIAKGSNDIFIQKLDKDGNFLWAIGLGSIGSDDANAVSTDTSGHVYITGSFRDTTDFDPSSNVVNAVAEGSADIFVLKLDSNGDFLWVKQMGGSGLDEGNTLTTDVAGNIYVAGRFIDSVDFDPGMGTLYIEATRSSSFIQKLTPNGDLVWAKAILGNGANEVFSIALDSWGYVYTTGDFSGTVDVDPAIGTLNVTSIGGTDIFIQKLDAAGNLVWAKQMGGIGLDEGHAVTIDASGAVYSLGRFNNTVDFDPGPGVTSKTTNGNDDVYLQKLTSNGDLIWVNTLGGSSFDDGRSLATDGAGNVYFVGHFSGLVDFDFGAGTLDLTANGGYDAFVQKVDANGNLLWVRSIGAVANDLGRGLVVDEDNGLYYTGYYRDTVDFDPGTGSLFLASAGDYDAFVSKLQACSVDTAVLVVGNILTASASNATYQWVDCATGSPIVGATNASFTPSINGDYQVLVTQHGCMEASSCYNVTVVGVEAVTATSLLIYPNPSTELINLEWGKEQATSISLLDVQGRRVLTTQFITSDKAQLSLRQLPAGVYYISITNQHQSSIHKIIKQ